MTLLRDHFSDEGNTIRKITEADRVKDLLHDKNERALPIENVLT